MTIPAPSRDATGGRRIPWTAYVRWLVILVAVTGALLLLRERLDKAHVALAFLIVVLGGSAAGGRAIGVVLALLAFLSFNFLFLLPHYTFVVADPLDWIVLVAFLITGVVAAHLLDRAQERALIAHQRALEVQRLAALGAETLNAGRAEDALREIAEVIRSTLEVPCCEIFVTPAGSTDLDVLVRVGSCRDDDPERLPWGLDTWVAQKHAVAAERPDGTKWIGSREDADELLRWPPPGTEIRALYVPLMVRERPVGVLHVSREQPFTLDPGRAQFLSALSYYAALGVERVRLTADAERAEAFRQADALKSALIAGVSHDLRTPLTTIKALAHSLRERGSAEAEAIEQEADRLNRLVADLLDLSRLNAGALRFRPELNTAEDLVGAAIRQVGTVIGERRIVVTNDDGLVTGRFDFVQSLRALVNLLENADKYDASGDPIEVTVARSGAELLVHVADRGPGVAALERERIFQPFYRAPGTPPDVGGVGLGLAIAKRLASEQGGDVRYEPRSGGGSVFTLVLPAADAPAPADRTAEGPS
jgi:two-component system sensor histidine kinase KdpD